MNIRECAWCGKAIYGHDYYWRLGSGKFYHRGCPADDGKGEASVVMGNNQESKCGGGGSGEIIISIDGKLSVCDSEVLKKENARLKELNREMVNALRLVCNNQCLQGKEKYCDNLSNDPCPVKEILVKAEGESYNG